MIIHPFDAAVQTTVTAIASTLLGVSGGAAALAGVIGFVVALYQHWNVRTPRWTGFLIQRPEAHMLHHERGVHARNFGDLPLWDMVFGTYDNPVGLRADFRVGFEPERGRQWMAMLLGRDVNRLSDAEAGRLAM
jgi:sterol desaturase/sphingolipid hydroxylase (fatty acid hydroxylase superfamily)